MAQKSADELTRDVLDELIEDPVVDNSAMQVTADHGNITLSGITSSYSSKWEAEDAAYRVRGVQSVTNNIAVDPAAFGARLDSDIAADIRSALALDLAVPNDRIEVTVSDGNVTLTGDVDWHYQRVDAEEDARRILGVRDIVDEIVVLQPTATAAEISDNIMRAFSRNAELFDDNVQVSASDDGRVTLSGSVETWTERDLAEDAAWRTRGVTEVIDNIEVELSWRVPHRRFPTPLQAHTGSACPTSDETLCDYRSLPLVSDQWGDGNAAETGQTGLTGLCQIKLHGQGQMVLLVPDVCRAHGPP
jgi:osmotically-inducible protein OsmY